jgi:protease I
MSLCLLVFSGYATATSLDGERVAVLITDGFHDEETEFPIDYFADQGATVTVIGPQVGEVEAYNSNTTVSIEKSIDEVSIDDFDALIIPGGHSPGNLVDHGDVVAFVRDFFLTAKPVAAICHGPLVLIAAEVVEGFEVTAYHSVGDELEDAGAEYTNQEVVVDRNLITSRQPDDLPAFVEAIDEALSQQTAVRFAAGGAHGRGRAGARRGGYTTVFMTLNGRRLPPASMVDRSGALRAAGAYLVRQPDRSGQGRLILRR